MNCSCDSIADSLALFFFVRTFILLEESITTAKNNFSAR